MQTADLVARAMVVAQEAHGSQVRKYTAEPYWKHCAEVAGILQAAGRCTAEMTAAAWLHDVLEDTEVTFLRLQRDFGNHVTHLVLGVTDVSRPEDGNRATRKAADRDHLARGCYEIQSIKLADLISNTGSIVVHDREFARVYLQEKRELLAVLTKGDEGLHRLAMRVLVDGERKLLES